MFSRATQFVFKSKASHSLFPSFLPKGSYSFKSSNKPPILLRQTKSEHSRRFWRNVALVSVPFVISGGYYLYHLEAVPVTKRKRFIATSIEYEKKVGDKTFSQIKQQYASKSLPDVHPASVKVKQIGMKLVQTSSVLRKRGYRWKFIVVDDPRVVNAFVLPSGKCFVFTGLLNLCESDDEIACVLGHELSHVICRHTGEALSNYQFRSFIILLIDAFFSIPIDFALNLATTVMLELPKSRKMETEADYIGLLVAKKAGFDPTATLRIWEKMTQLETEGGIQLLRTHPPSEERISNMKKWLESDFESLQ